MLLSHQLTYSESLQSKGSQGLIPSFEWSSGLLAQGWRLTIPLAGKCAEPSTALSAECFVFEPSLHRCVFPFQMRRKTPSHNLLARLTAPYEFSFVSVAHECCLPASEILHSLKMHKSVEKSMRSPQVLSGTLSQHMLYMCFYLEMLHFVPLKNTNQNKNISKYAHSTIFTCYPR